MTPTHQGHSARLHGLDHVRALAIILVFFFHYSISIFGHPDWVPAVFSFGWTGVDLFFVLSGFLITSQLFGQMLKGGAISFRVFFLKRAFRILPAFWIVVSIYFLFPFFREKEALPALWRFLTFTQNFDLDLHSSGTFSHAWSLCVEEHFYLFLPLTLIALAAADLFRKSYWLLPGLFLFGIAIRSYSWLHFYQPGMTSDTAYIDWYKYIYYPTYNRLDGLLVGVSIAAVYCFQPGIWHRISAYGNFLLAMGGVLLACAYQVCMEQDSFVASVFGFPLVAFGYGFIVAGAISPTSFLYKWKSRPTAHIATLSYAIYLTHKGVIHVTQTILSHSLGINIDTNITLLVCILTCFTVATLLHVFIERPFLRFRDSLLLGN